MLGSAVIDAHSVVHCTQSGPQPCLTWCGVLFYTDELVLEPWALAGLKHPYTRPMSRVETPVSCMTCLVRECP